MPSKPTPNPNSPAFTVRLRKELIGSLVEMHQNSGGHLTLQDFAGQLLEAAIASYRSAKLAADRQGTPESPPNGYIRSRFQKLDRQRILALSEQDVSATAISVRMHCAPMSIRRVLNGRRGG
jgi:hypothetical protein